MRAALWVRALSESRAVYLASISEADFQQSVVEFLEFMGYIVWHARDSRRQKLSGLVDLIAVSCRDPIAGRPSRKLLMWELKTQRGRLSAAQVVALRLLARVPGVDARCLRPAEWDALAERIKREEGIER